MTSHHFTFHGAELAALPSGALHWPAEDLLTVSDLHLGKSARLAVSGGAQLPPYEARETLHRLEADLMKTGARRVICLGDSFDMPGIEDTLPEDDRLRITRLQAGRDWTWIEGNHDPGPVALGGQHRAVLRIGKITLRHIAVPRALGEISGHYHPKARIHTAGRSLSRPCFLLDAQRLLLPAYGTYTGGLRSSDATLCQLMDKSATAILTGRRAIAIPMPR